MNLHKRIKQLRQVVGTISTGKAISRIVLVGVDGEGNELSKCLLWERPAK